MRDSYKCDEIERFRKNADKYLNIEQSTRKSISACCDYLGITVKTLSKYKFRDSVWLYEVNRVKSLIRQYNTLLRERIIIDKLLLETEALAEEQKQKQIDKEQEELQKRIDANF